jgi:hypothetical protein
MLRDHILQRSFWFLPMDTVPKNMWRGHAWGGKISGEMLARFKYWYFGVHHQTQQKLRESLFTIRQLTISTRSSMSALGQQC